MDTQLDPTTGDYSGRRIRNLGNAVYLRLRTPLGSWWADPTLGSRLHELARELDVPRIRKLARQYAEQALEPLLLDGRALSIVVTAEHLRTSWCRLTIKVQDQSGQEQHFQHHTKVG